MRDRCECRLQVGTDLKMVNPLMSSHVAKMEPIVSFGLGDCGTEESNSVKIELENCDTNETTVKMELDEFQMGLFDNEHEQLRLSDSESKDSLLGSDMLLGPSSSYSTDPVGLSMIRTVNLPKHQGDAFPVLSIPNSSIFSISSANLEIAISPASSQGPDTTTLTSPPPSSSSQSAQRKTAYTAKGFKSFLFSFEERPSLLLVLCKCQMLGKSLHFLQKGNTM